MQSARQHSVARPANIHYIPPALCRASPFSLRGGAEGIRTPDLRRAKAALSQLSYGPARRRVGQPGIEPGTSVLSGLRSSRLSYWPHWADRPSVAHARAEHTPAVSVGRAGSSACLSIGGTGKGLPEQEESGAEQRLWVGCASQKGVVNHARGVRQTTWVGSTWEKTLVHQAPATGWTD